jgi:site-specific recombinase XerD
MAPVRDADVTDALVGSWTRHLRAANRSPKTIKSYRAAAEQFAAFLAEQGHSADLTAVARSDVEAFIAELCATRSASTAATRYRGLQQLFSWLAAEGEIATSPMAGMRPPAVGEPEVPVPALADVAALLSACQGRDFADRRDLALFRLMADTGARLAETAGLGTADVDLDNPAGAVVQVAGKGRRDRTLPLGKKAVADLDRYLRARARRRDRDAAALWLGVRGPMTASGITQALRKRCDRAGIDRLHPHQLRHYFAHQYKLAGGGDAELARLGGWRSPEMLQRYGSSAADQRARESHRRLSPGDQL